MWRMPMYRKRGKSFRGRKTGCVAAFMTAFAPSKSEQETTCFNEHPAGGYNGRSHFCFAYPITVWATPFPKGDFVSADGLYGRYRPEEKKARQTVNNEK